MSEQEQKIKPRRKNKPGAGRKPKQSTLFKQGTAIQLQSFPEISKNIVNRALGVASNVQCPECNHKFDVKLGEGMDRELAIQLDNRIQGKPTVKTEVELSGKIELSQPVLNRFYMELITFGQSFDKQDYTELLNRIEQLPPPADQAEAKLLDQEADRKAGLIATMSDNNRCATRHDQIVANQTQEKTIYNDEYVDYDLPEQGMGGIPPI